MSKKNKKNKAKHSTEKESKNEKIQKSKNSKALKTEKTLTEPESQTIQIEHEKHWNIFKRICCCCFASKTVEITPETVQEQESQTSGKDHLKQKIKPVSSFNSKANKTVANEREELSTTAPKEPTAAKYEKSNTEGQDSSQIIRATIEKENIENETSTHSTQSPGHSPSAILQSATHHGINKKDRQKQSEFPEQKCHGPRSNRVSPTKTGSLEGNKTADENVDAKHTKNPSDVEESQRTNCDYMKDSTISHTSSDDDDRKKTIHGSERADDKRSTPNIRADADTRNAHQCTQDRTARTRKSERAKKEFLDRPAPENISYRRTFPELKIKNPEKTNSESENAKGEISDTKGSRSIKTITADDVKARQNGHEDSITENSKAEDRKANSRRSKVGGDPRTQEHEGKNRIEEDLRMEDPKVDNPNVNMSINLTDDKSAQSYPDIRTPNPLEKSSAEHKSPVVIRTAFDRPKQTGKEKLYERTSGDYPRYEINDQPGNSDDQDEMADAPNNIDDSVNHSVENIAEVGVDSALRDNVTHCEQSAEPLDNNSKRQKKKKSKKKNKNKKNTKDRSEAEDEATMYHESFVTEIQVRRPIGLRNLGNTCFFNSVMQNLYQSFLLEKCLCELSMGHPKGKMPLTKAMIEFYRQMDNDNDQCISPQAVFGNIGRISSRFTGFRQQDSHELLRHLLDGLRDEERKVSKESEKRKILTKVDKVFGGHFMTIYTCKKCKEPYHVCEPMLDISLPIAYSDDIHNEMDEESDDENKKEYAKAAKRLMTTLTEVGSVTPAENDLPVQKQNDDAGQTNTAQGSEDESGLGKKRKRQPGKNNSNRDSLNKRPRNENDRSSRTRSVCDCLATFTRKEHIDKEYLCMECYKKGMDEGETEPKLTSATKRALVYNPPALLTLHLKRFEQTHHGFVKSNVTVSFPFQLDLAPYCSRYCMRNEANSKNIWYSLYGVVVHSGDLSGGHYVAYVKARTQDNNCEQFLQKEFLDRDLLTPARLTEIVKEFRNHSYTERSEPSIEGNWFYISDSHVEPAGEEEVMSRQAYLLFYERVQCNNVLAECSETTSF